MHHLSILSIAMLLAVQVTAIANVEKADKCDFHGKLMTPDPLFFEWGNGSMATVSCQYGNMLICEVPTGARASDIQECPKTPPPILWTEEDIIAAIGAIEGKQRGKLEKKVEKKEKSLGKAGTKLAKKEQEGKSTTSAENKVKTKQEGLDKAKGKLAEHDAKAGGTARALADTTTIDAPSNATNNF